MTFRPEDVVLEESMDKTFLIFYTILFLILNPSLTKLKCRHTKTFLFNVNSSLFINLDFLCPAWVVQINMVKCLSKPDFKVFLDS